jgi:hypothetical protein
VSRVVLLDAGPFGLVTNPRRSSLTISCAGWLSVAAYVLTGLRLKSPDEVRQLFQGASIAMRESVTYQAILEEGDQTARFKELHRTILRQGRRRFEEADEATRQRIEAMRDIERLENLSEQLVIVSSWDELMA